MSANDSPERTGPRRGLVGRVIGDRYRVTRVVVRRDGHGHRGRRRRASCSRPVTVKLVRPEWAESPEFRQRFARAMKVMAKLSHPNLAAVYDWGEEDIGRRTTVYAVVEPLSGGSLRDLLDRGRLLDPSQALLVGLEACRGLDFAHHKGLVHTELTPAKLVFGDDRRLADHRLRARPPARRAGLERAGDRGDARRPVRLAGAGAGPAGRRQVRRLLAGADPRRGRHGHGPVRRSVDGGHAVGARRTADAGVGRPRSAGVGARTGRSTGAGGAVDGGRVRAGARAQRREPAPPNADSPRRHERASRTRSCDGPTTPPAACTGRRIRRPPSPRRPRRPRRLRRLLQRRLPPGRRRRGAAA